MTPYKKLSDPALRRLTKDQLISQIRKIEMMFRQERDLYLKLDEEVNVARGVTKTKAILVSWMHIIKTLKGE